MRLSACFPGVVAALALCGVPRAAQGFERQWHLGGGAGLSTLNDASLGPALNLYGAYGLSDVFDARLELTARGYSFLEELNPHGLSAMAGVAYKLDVIRWVPWAGLYVGYQGFLGVPRPDTPFRQHDLAVALGLGLDYAVSRPLGLGVTLRYDQTLREVEGRTFDALVRAEYRWGW